MLQIPAKLDRQFISSCSDSLLAGSEFMGYSVRSSQIDFALETETTLPLPIKAYENEKRYSTSEVLAQATYYRRPNYLLLEANLKSC
jgi:hypothetical protein